jgi:hypothetical protein
VTRVGIIFVVVITGTLLTGGCPPENFPNALPTTLDVVLPIAEDETLTPNERRIQIAALGVSQSTINVLLRGETLGNQYGGDLRTAYTKVVNDRLTGLTPDEVQIYALGASDVDEELDVEWSDIEAQAIVDFFAFYGLTSVARLEAFLDSVDTTVPEDVSEEDVRAIFVDFDAALLLPSLP